jgi:signal peptide peptidase SppA
MGGFEAAAAVRAAAEQKPVIAVVNGMAASAAYAIASGATKIVTMGTGIAGSIGVVLLHLELSEYMHNQGIEPTLIFAGEHKVDGNPFEPLPESVRADMQAKVLSYYDDFVETILAGRKSLTAKAIRATGARIFKGREAVAAGLADEVGTLEEVLANLSTLRSRSAPSGRPSVTSTHGGTHTMAPEEQNAAASIPAETATTLVSPVVTAPAGGPTVAVATAPPQVVTPSPVATSLTTDECAELASIGAGAARLGVNVDVVAAIRQGVKPDALRKQVLDAAATRDEGSAIVTAAPAQASPPPAGQSAIVARAREVAAASGAKQQRH